MVPKTVSPKNEIANLAPNYQDGTRSMYMGGLKLTYCHDFVRETRITWQCFFTEHPKSHALLGVGTIKNKSQKWVGSCLVAVVLVVIKNSYGYENS